MYIFQSIPKLITLFATSNVIYINILFAVKSTGVFLSTNFTQTTEFCYIEFCHYHGAR